MTLLIIYYSMKLAVRVFGTSEKNEHLLCWENFQYNSTPHSVARNSA